MFATKHAKLVSVAAFLAEERESPIKREYVGGAVYARPEECNAHNLIASNVLGFVGSRLRGTRYRPFDSDTKVRIRLPTHVRFYYPDAMAVGRSNGPTEWFQDDPALIVEVLSRATRRIDENEKKDAYLTIASLSVYLLVEQEIPAITAFRRTEHGFVREVYEGLDAMVPLGEIETELPLAEVFEAVEFHPEPSDDESN